MLFLLPVAAVLPGQSILVNGQKVDLPMVPVMVLTGEGIGISDLEESDTLGIIENSLGIETAMDKDIKLKAPKRQGIYPVTFMDKDKKKTTISIVVLVPSSKIKDGKINNYKIGTYPERNKKTYGKPVGFIEVTEENRDVLLTPHFRLGQFLCKQEGSYPRYLVLKSSLLIKLEKILEKYNIASSEKAKTFFIMSGYRTPYYNLAIKNVKFSRHIYGDAVDFYVDNNNDGYTDDLNGDGKIDKKDLDVLKKIIEEMDSNGTYKRLIGGMGTYRANSRHGPFIHVDTRGYKARW